MKNKTLVFFYLFLVISFSALSFYFGIQYQKKIETEFNEAKPMNYVGDSNTISYLHTQALRDGDTLAYYSLTTYYLDFPIADYFPIAFEMANKHKFPQAYFDVFDTIIMMENLNLEYNSTSELNEWNELDFKESRIAMDYLLTAAKLNHNQAKDILREYFIKGKKLSLILDRHKDLIIEYSEVLISLQE